MKTKKSFLLKTVQCSWILLFLMAFSATAQDYTWKRVKIGAGGWVTGMDIQKNGRYAYCRTDVGGAYRLDLQGNSTEWKQLLSVTSMPASKVGLGRAFEPDESKTFKGVASIRPATSDENRVYMMYNDIMYRSNNKGDTWTPTTLNVKTLSNESGQDSKLVGERITVDPVNKDVVYYGSNENGLYLTSNAGNDWTKINAIPDGTAPFGITGIEIDASSPTTNGKKTTIYVAVRDLGIYRSTNGGSNWGKMSAPSSSYQITDTAIDADGTFYYTTYNGGVFRFKNGNWSTLPSPSNFLIDVSVDPFDTNNVVITNISGTLYASKNQGDGGWIATDDEKSITANDIPWLAWADEENFLSVGEVVHDPKVNGRLWMSNGTGVYYADYGMTAGEVNWISRNVGIEELICKDVIKAPGQKLVQLSMDRPIFVIEDEDEFPNRHFPDDQFQSAWDGDYCAGTPQFMAVIMSNENFFKEHETSGWSDDGGRTWTRFASMPDWPGKKEQNKLEQGYGSIAVSSTDPNNILMNNTGLFTGVAPSEENLTNLYYTANRGVSWQKSQGIPERNGHPVRYHNRKNICADAISPSTFYFYHWIEGGLFKSTDKGQSFTKVNSTLPASAVHLVLKPVLGKEGHILWSAGYDRDSPLMLSTDGGVTFTSISGDNVVYNFGIGKALNDYPTIFVQGRFNGQDGYYRSTDRGASWQQIGTFPLDTYGTIGGMDGDKEVFGKVYVGTESFGVFSGTSGGETTVAVDGIVLTPSTASVQVGETVQLQKSVSPANATNKAVTWISDDTAVAMVDSNGKVSGIAPGNVTVTATTRDGNKTATSTITVTEGTTGGNGQNYGFETGNLSGWDTTGTPGIETWAARTGNYGAVLTASSDVLRKDLTGLSPNTTYAITVWTYVDGTSGSLSVSASDFGGATVTKNSVTTLSWIKTDITFSTGVSNTIATLTLKASEMPSGWIWLDDISLETIGTISIPPSDITATPNETELLVGAAQAITVVVNPSNATDKTVSYSSNDTSIATVDANGTITAVSPGNTAIVIRAVLGNATTTVNVTVLEENSTNLIQNPGFERNTPLEFWGAYNAAVRVKNRKTGQFGVRMGGNANTDGYLSQVVTDLTPNTTYTLGFWSKTNNGNTMYAGVNRSGDDQQLALTATTWTENTLTFTTGANNTEAEVYLWIGNGQTGFADDFELTQGGSPRLTGTISDNQEIRIYPNGTKGDFTVSLGKEGVSRALQIFDLQGRSVYQKSVTGSEITLNTSTLRLPSGLYLVTVRDGNTEQTTKLIVE